MTLDDGLERWAYWLLNGGCASTSDLSRLISPSESVMSGETSVKPKPPPLVNNDNEKMFNEAIIEGLTVAQRLVILSEYRILQLMPCYEPDKQRKGVLIMSSGAYRNNLYKARKKLHILTGYPRT